MPGDERDQQVRSAAFDFLAQQTVIHGEVLPRSLLVQGFNFEGRRVPLLGPQGIFKPAVISSGVPLSITTAPAVPGKIPPYEDAISPDGFLMYRYRGTDPNHHDNVGLRRAMAGQIPLIYFSGVDRGLYHPEWPVFVAGDDPDSLTFTVAFDDPEFIRPDLRGSPGIDEIRRRYVTRQALARLHQVVFRQHVLAAYSTTCAMCRLRHSELLDAAHILPDGHPRGDPVVPNGMALCKIHHAAFDTNIVGVRPDLVVEVRSDVLTEVDGPMLRHGLQGIHGNRLVVVPRRAELRPSVDRLEERYESFRRAG